MISVSICTATYRRPALLRELLESLATHDFTGLDVELVVADNDREGTGLAVVEELRERLPFPVVTRLVERPNISLVRNALVEAAGGELVLFIDDDETPVPGWARAHVAALERYGADAVIGPVLPRYGDDIPAWVREGGFFEPRDHVSGEVLPPHRTYSGNTLVRASLLRDIPGPFDVEFGLTGSEDTLMFWDLTERGGKVVWCEDAAIRESVPADRATEPWLVRRAYSGGQNFVRLETHRLHGADRLRRAAVLAASALVRLVVAAALTAVLTVLARLRPSLRASRVRWRQVLAAQRGKLTGLLGARYQYYASS